MGADLPGCSQFPSASHRQQGHLCRVKSQVLQGDRRMGLSLAGFQTAFSDQASENGSGLTSSFPRACLPLKEISKNHRLPVFCMRGMSSLLFSSVPAPVGTCKPWAAAGGGLFSGLPGKALCEWRPTGEDRFSVSLQLECASPFWAL